MVACAKQLKYAAEGSSGTTTEAILPMELKSCVDAQNSMSFIPLGFIVNIKSFADMTDEAPRAYLENEAEDSKEDVTVEGLDELV